MAAFASILEDDPSTTYLLPIGGGYYHVPIENVMAKSTRTNPRSCGEIDALLRSHSPEAWKRCLTFGHVLRIRGVEGNALYTTFTPTDGAIDEQRVLRLVPWRVAHACFPEVKEWARCDPNNRLDFDRMAIYDWRKEVDLPNAPHLNPVLNHWPEAILEWPVVDRTRAQMAPSPSTYAYLGTSQRSVPHDLLAALPNGSSDVDARDNAFFEELGQVHAALERLGRTRPPPLPPPPPPPPPPAARPPASVLEDLRVLSDFLFECKDVVCEGAYLAASDALKRVWDRAI